MLNKIKSLEAITRQLEPDNSVRTAWMQQLTYHTNHYLDKNLEESSKVFVSDTVSTPLDLNFDTPTPFESILKLLDKSIYKDALNAASPKHFAYIPGGGLFSTAIADFIGAMCNKYVGIKSVAPNASQLENDIGTWLAKIVGYDTATAAGSMASGGSIATLTAIIAARDAKLSLQDYHKAVVYMTKETHYCINKGLRIAGLNPPNHSCIHYIDVDEHYKMNTLSLEKAIKADKLAGKIPFMVIGNLGTVNLGAIDPLEKIGKIANAHDLWFHIDGAYGGFFLLSNKKKDLIGVELSDSIVMDAHKSMFVSYGLGCVVVKNRNHLLEAFQYTADYLNEGASMTSANISPELTKPFRSLRMWLPLKLFGLKPFVAALNEKLLLAQYTYQQLQQKENYRLINQPELSVLAFQYIPPKYANNAAAINAFNQVLLEEIIKDGQVFLSPTTINGEYMIRIAILSFRTHLKEVKLLLRVLDDKIEEVGRNFTF